MAAIDSVPRETPPARPPVGGPTVVVGLGSFGGVVLDRLRSAGVGAATSLRPRQVLLALEPSGEVGEHVTQIVARAESLLGLDAAFDADPGDDRRPQLDVFVVADLGDAAVARALPELVTATGERLLTRFSNIFPGHDLPNLTICPVVALLGVRGGDGAAAARGALLALESRAGSVKFRTGDASPVARV